MYSVLRVEFDDSSQKRIEEDGDTGSHCTSQGAHRMGMQGW